MLVAIVTNTSHCMFCFVFGLLFFQTVCLAEFKQIRSIKCTAQSDGKTLLEIDIKGAKQVSILLWFQAI